MGDDQPTGDPPPPPRDRPPPKPWRPVAGLAGRPSRMAFSDRLFHWFVYAGGLALIALGLFVIWLPYFPVQGIRINRRFGVYIIVAGVAVFCLGGPSAAQEKGYRD